MGVERIGAQQVSEHALDLLGLDAASIDLRSPEALAASIRRAASFLCPATPGRILNSVMEALRGLSGFGEETQAQLETMLAALVGYGDLLELPVEADGTRRRQLFLGVPAFVRRATNTCFLLGVRPEGAPLVADDLLMHVEHDNHIRAIREASAEVVDEMLTVNGLVELQAEQWLQAPRTAAPADVVSSYATRLVAARTSGEVEGLRVIDPSSPVTYYRGRWRPLKTGDSGRFVARRPQAFGADLWCLAEVAGGEVTKILDLPIEAPLAPGADEAWRLQAALDAIAGSPQPVRLGKGTRPGWATIDLFGPVPSWMQRRLDAVATPLPRSRGALFSYELLEAEAEEELAFARRLLWLEPITDAGSGQ